VGGLQFDESRGASGRARNRRFTDVTTNSRVVRIALSAVLAALVLVLVPGAFAGKGGNGGNGGPGGGSSGATLTLSPTAVPSGASFLASGCGYTAGKQVNVVISSPTYDQFWPAGVDANGCVSFGGWTGQPGAYTVSTYQQLKGHQQTLMASASLTVY
jgi:hypothetical protein